MSPMDVLAQGSPASLNPDVSLREAALVMLNARHAWDNWFEVALDQRIGFETSSDDLIATINRHSQSLICKDLILKAETRV